MSAQERLYETIDFRSERTLRKYLGFIPIDQYIMGLRYFKSSFSATGGKFEISVIGKKGPVICQSALPGEGLNIMPAGAPHHVKGLFGYWHINEVDEFYIPVPLENGDSVLVLLEGMPKTGRWDRFAQFCLNCYTKLCEKAVPTGDVGIEGFFKGSEDLIKMFNSDPKLRICKNCGAVHPLGYDFFWHLKGSPEEKSAAYEW